MNALLDRFLRYVKIDTQSDETSEASPSTAKQLDLSRLLLQECQELGLENISLNEGGVVTATVPANVDHSPPAIAWVAHVDTSPECSGKNVNPVIHENYQGGDIPLPNDTSQVITVAENPTLNDLIGATIITTDGTTLLGADDKSGVAVIMTAAAELMANPNLSHGPIRLVFTCDEEIGRGTEHVNIDELDCVCAYTLDGEGSGMVDSETFSADLAVITVNGANTHPSVGKDKMVNAIRILSKLLAKLPTETDAPEVTEGRDGFLHPYHIEGGVAKAEARIILRDFETTRLAEYATMLQGFASELETEFPKATIDVVMKEQYRNMRDGLGKEPRALPLAIDATAAAGLTPQPTIIRGGTDGSLLTEQGLPTPNLSTGEHNPHCPLEWTSLEEMQSAVRVLVELARLWGKESA